MSEANLSRQQPHAATAGWSFVRPAPWPIITLALVAASLILQFIKGWTFPSAPVVAVISLGLLRVVPPRLTVPDPLADKDDAQIRAQLRPLLLYALLYPLVLIPVVIWGREHPIPLFPGWSSSWAFSVNYHVVGKILLLGLPTLLFLWHLRDLRSLGLHGITNPWRWIGPLIGQSFVLIVIPLFLAGPSGLAQLPLWLLAALVVLSFCSAGFTEELFYRVLLQTRLERLCGRWNAIAVSALLFGLFHLPSRFAFVWLGTTGSVGWDAVQATTGVVTGQVVLGAMAGYMWTRFRNAWWNVGAHTIMDFLAFVALLTRP
jgi:membrane protease YdiL (CAAX protease family)